MSVAADLMFTMMLTLGSVEFFRRVFLSINRGPDRSREDRYDPSERPLWRYLGRKHGLKWSLAPGPHYTLRGEIDGIPVAVEWPDRGQFNFCLFRATILPPLPPGTRIATRGEGPPGLKLGHPILDASVRADLGGLAGPEDEAALRSRLAPEDVCGALLAVVHQWPGSVVEGDQILLTFPLQERTWTLDRWAEATSAPMLDLLALAQALSGPAQLEGG